MDLYRNLLLLVEEKVVRYLAVVLLGLSIFSSSGANGRIGLLNSVTVLGLLALSVAVHLCVSIRVHRANQPVRLWPLSPHAVLATGIGIASIAAGWLQPAIGAIPPMLQGIGVGSAYAMVAMLVIGSVTNFAIYAASSARS